MKTETKPLSKSRSKVVNAKNLFPVLSTFVAPIFPEPISDKLPNLNNLENIIPKGIEPNKYDKSDKIKISI